MPCDSTPFFAGQTLQSRKDQVRKAISALDRLIAKGVVKAKVGPQGAIAFNGWTGADRAGLSDACAYRKLMVDGSSIAKAEIQRAEAMAGRSVSREALAQGVHTHDGGVSWGRH